MSPRPGWVAGKGELLRAYRKYVGLSLRGFAVQCGIKEKSLLDMEVGRRDIPEGVFDTVESVMERFDAEVEQTIAQAEQMLEDNPEGVVEFRVTDEPDEDWVRAVIGRAAVTSGLIVPILDGTYHARREDRAG